MVEKRRMLIPPVTEFCKAEKRMKLKINLEYECDFELDNVSEAIISQAFHEKNYMRKVKEELDKIFLPNEVKRGKSRLKHLGHEVETIK